MLSGKVKNELKEVANLLVSPGKGILAADEPIEHTESIFKPIGLKNDEENRRQYRQILFTCSNINESVSGVILHPETVFQATNEGVPFVKLLRDNKILPGVNVDGGLINLEGTSGETTTKGLDVLDGLCKKFKGAGCCFAKWRCAFRVTRETPSALAIKENAHVLARYGTICQANGLVPIIEPDVQLDGEHNLDRARVVSEAILAQVYTSLKEFGVYLEGTILKTSMVTPGRSCKDSSSKEDIAECTIQVVSRSVPAAVPGIGFLSGGQTPEQATANLAAINRCKGRMPWALTFIFGRALQDSVASIWGGKKGNIPKAQARFLELAKANSKASLSR